MNKVVSELSVGKYTVLVLDEQKTNKRHRKYLIGGKEYLAIPVYDAKNCIAIEAEPGSTFVGEIVEYV